jgi:hypothetical protein
VVLSRVASLLLAFFLLALALGGHALAPAFLALDLDIQAQRPAEVLFEECVDLLGVSARADLFFEIRVLNRIGDDDRPLGRDLTAVTMLQEGGEQRT